MDKIFTSEIGKVSIYNSPTITIEQIVVDMTLETVITLSGDIVITRAKEAFLNKKSPVNKRFDISSNIEKIDIERSAINKTAVLITEAEKTR